MKTALEWLNAVGEAAGQDMFCNTGNEKPGSRTEEIIKLIQQDALDKVMKEVLPVVELCAGKFWLPAIAPAVIALHEIRDELK